MQSWIFSIITPVFSVTWSFRNHYNMLLKKLFFYYYQCWTQLSCLIFLWKPWYIFLENSKEQHLFEIENFCNIINEFTVTFDQFNASLLGLGIIFILTIPIPLIDSVSYWLQLEKKKKEIRFHSHLFQFILYK